MPYSKSSDVPDNVPAAHKAQFMEVWNSAYAAAKADKKSDKDAEQSAFAQAWGVITKAMKRGSTDSGKVIEQPGSAMTAAPGAAPDPRYAPDQPRDRDGKFSSGKQNSPHESDPAKKAGPVTHDPTGEGQAPTFVTTARLPADITHKPGTQVGDKVESIFGSKGTIKGFAGDKTQVDVDGRLEYWHVSHFKRQEKYMSIERRYSVELRVGAALGGNSQGDEMALAGYAARFGVQSKDLGGFKETIAPGAFKRAIDTKADVRCLFNHDQNKVLGRTAAGTLTLNEDADGLAFRCQLDSTNTDHRNLWASVKRGDINEMSFAFTPNGDNGDQWEDRQDPATGGWYISRTLKDVNLYDVSLVTHPAYDNTSVAAREENITSEIRNIISKLVEKRAKRPAEKRDQSLQEFIDSIRKALSEKFPDPDTTDGCACPSCSGQYWVCDVYDDYLVASDYKTNSDFVKIPFVENPDGTGFVFGTPVPVEKDWVPTERAKSVQAEQRAFNAAHMQAIADAHKAQQEQHAKTAADHIASAADSAAQAEAHAAAAVAAQQEADRCARCEASGGNCDVKGCRCQNQMRDIGDIFDIADLWNDDDKDEMPEDERNKRIEAEKRDGDGKTRTKTVGGKSLPASAFAFVGDPNDTSTWKYPVHDADHARNALARWGQHTGIPSDKEAGVYARIKAAAKKFNIEVSEPDAAKAARSHQPMTQDEVTDWNNRLRLEALR